MAIRSFDVGGRKTLIRAQYDALPDLVFITGGNGAGKSSLLILLKDQGIRETNTKVMHLGPHRPWRKGNLLKAAVLSMPMNFNDMLASTNIPHFQGVVPQSIASFQGHARDADASDEAQALVKVAIAGINEKYRDRLQELHQEHGAVESGAVPDPFDPLRQLLQRLLPHLAFDKIEETDRNNVRVLFRSVFSQQGTSYDVDELSSGEKAVLTLFLPVLEYQMEKALGILHQGELRTFLIDEPELHLHPALQADVVAYLRHLTLSEGVQFIVVTHSPTMIDAALPDELFVVTPWQASATGNQFSQLADSADRLLAIKELLGSAYSYARSRPVVFIEGEFPEDTSKHTDLGLLELILPDMRGYAFVPSKGKTQAITAAGRLRRAAAEQEHSVTAFALVDSDYDEEARPWVLPWPVCMVENLLLDADAIAKVLSPYVAQGGLPNGMAVTRELNSILNEMREEEIERRLKAVAGTLTLRPYLVRGNASYRVSFEEGLEKGRETMQAKVEAASAQIIEEVGKELADGSAIRRFHGKTVLKRFFDQNVQQHIPKYVNFAFSVAREVAVSGSAEIHVRESIRRINDFYPPELVHLLETDDLSLIGPQHGVDIEGLRRWSTARLERFRGKRSEVEADLDYQRQLVVLLRALENIGRHELCRQLRPHVVDILAR